MVTAEPISAQLARLAELLEDWLTETRRARQPAMPDWDAAAFRWRGEGHLEAIRNPDTLPLDLLQGIETQKQRLVANTRQFVEGRTANNALLWGARGTGKSSLIRALLGEFADQGLRIIEVGAERLIELPDIVALLDDRPERFVIYSDDLSFEAGDARYKALKATLDGSLAATPDNALIYATSNRRHLLPEYQAENQQSRQIGGEIHHGEAVEEKISLSERFGLWLSFYPFDQAHYLAIAARHLEALGVRAEPGADQPWERAALQWALTRGNRSGRTAEQFARDWAGQQTRHA